MWHALRAELVYHRAPLLAAFGIAAGVIVLLITVFWLVPEADGPSGSVVAGLTGFFPVIAGMVVGFIAQGYRSEERRARLLLAGPLTPQQLAGVMVILPAALLGTGLLVSGLVVGISWAITGKLELETLRIISQVAGMLLAIGQMGPLAQESSAAHRQLRTWSALVGWTVFGLAILLLALLQLHLDSFHGHLGQPMVGVMAGVVSAGLYTGRTDFTR
jgi:hypothetical protein